MFRCAKNGNGVIIAMGTDQGQSGNYPSDNDIQGIWCTWTVDENDLPAFSAVSGADPFAMRFKENGTADGIDVRSDADVLATPNG